MNNKNLNDEMDFNEIQKVIRSTYGTLGLAFIVAIDFILFYLGYRTVNDFSIAGPIVLIGFIIWNTYKLRKTFKLFK